MQKEESLAFLSNQTYTCQVEETVHGAEEREYGPIPGLDSQCFDECRVGRGVVQLAAINSEDLPTRLFKDGLHHGRLAATLRSV